MSALIPDERRRQLLALVTELGSVGIAQLAERLGVSHMTVRRDIGLLEEAGRVVSVSGGVTLPSRIALDATHEVKLGMQPAEKQAIAEAAFALIQPGDLIYLDAGTTMLAIANRLAKEPREYQVDVVTNDLAVAAVVGARPGARVHLLGGRLDAPNMATEGPIAAAAVAEFNINLAFVSASSFDLRGLSVPTDAKVVVKRALAEHSARSYLVTDSTKYGRVAAFRAVPLGALNGIVTDAGLPQTAREHLIQLGLDLHVAEPANTPPAAAPAASKGDPA